MTTRLAQAQVAYITDLEGMFDKLESFAEANPLVQLDADGRLLVRDGAVLVYGGDTIDRGPGARRLLATLLEAHRRQPGQVVLLAGNRDINKLRLARELTGEPPARTPDDVRHGPRPALLRWIFEHTMGAKGAFEFRAEELGAVSEEQVVDSFLEDLAPGGLMRAYLASAQLAYRHGRTLFVHGGLGRESLGAVPGQAPVAPEAVDVDAWAAALNHWYAQQVDAFVAGALDAGRPAWAPLIAYQAPLPGRRENPGSVVYGRLADQHNNLHLPDASVIAALARAGVARVIIGHTPSGDSPSILRDHEHGFELVCADNSHARHRVGSKLLLADDFLGVDAAAVLDGATVPSRICFTLDAADHGSPIGRRTPEGRLVKGPLGEDGFLTYRALAGWKIEQLELGPADLGALEAPR